MAKIVLLLLALFGVVATAQELQPSKVTASAQCGGELRLTMKAPKLKAHNVDKRDIDEPSFLFDVSYKLVESEEETSKQFAAFSARKGQYEALLSGLQPGQHYGIRVRLGVKEEGQVKWGEFSDEVKAVSGQILAEDGPAGIGEGRSYCQTRQRRRSSDPGMAPRGKKLKRTPRQTYSRRRTYANYNYYYNYYNSYYCSYYSNNRCSTSVAGAIAGGVIGLIFLISALVICCKCYYYGGCGRPAYRYHGGGGGFAMAHTTMATTGVSTMPATAGSIPIAMPVAQPMASGATVYPNTDTGDYGNAPYPTKGTDSAVYESAMYPPAPGYPGAAGAGAANPGYPSAYPSAYPAAAPPPYPGPGGNY